MDELTSIAEQSWYDNYIWQYGIFILFIIAGLIFKRFFSRIISFFLFKFFRKYREYIAADAFYKLLRKPLMQTFMLIFIYLAFMQISFPEKWDIAPQEEFGVNMVLIRIYSVLLISSIIWIFLRLTDFMSLIMKKRAEKHDNIHSINQLIPFITDGIKIIIGIFGLFFILGSVFNVNVATLIAGLGIGGLALALAAKESLENLMGSFTIFLDKPFVVGDFVQVGGVLGVVEKIGFRSTRLRTLEKSYVTLPNKKMVDQELDNLSLRTSRRAMYTIGVTYSTTKEQIQAIIKDIQELIDNHPETSDDGMVRFSEFGSSSLDIMVLFFVNTMNWGTFLSVKQEINFKIMEIVKKHKAEFAFPSTSVYIEKE